MTNIGIVPARARLPRGRSVELCDETGTLLINDETHTFSAGVGGCTRAWGLRPDIVTIGKAHRRRHPHRRLRRQRESSPSRILGDADADLVDQGGVGGTLAGNALVLGGRARHPRRTCSPRRPSRR